MRFLTAVLWSLCAFAGLTGCAHTYANLAVEGDAKFPVTLQDKFTLAAPSDPTAETLPNRLAGETLAAQLQALGYQLAPAAEADFQLTYNLSTKDVPITYGVTVPTMTGIGGDIYGRPMAGAGMGEMVVPQTRIANFTYLDITLQRLHDPKLQIWQGHINAETGDVQHFHAAFFRALLAHMGATASGVVQLDGTPDPAATAKK